MRGIYNAAGSMLVNQVRLENISNNLANLNTPGYKRSEVVVGAFPEILLHRIEKNSNGRTNLFLSGIAAENIAVEDIFHVHTGGALRSTDRLLDLALQGEGFFVLETPDGLRFGRDGHFKLNGEGVLVNSQGFPLLGEAGVITIEAGQPMVDREGNVYDNGKRVDRLRLLAFASHDSLFKDGYGLFQAGPGVIPQQAEDTVIFQGFLEESNADLSRQMTDMLKVRRSYEAAQKISQAYDRMLSRAANELGSLR
ncbi:MAG: flagellar hook-basal body protein [Bacillota bacterium]|nr:flagellar hook-basal body protein [Bacillota bacterium]